jgi:hypothetical protein
VKFIAINPFLLSLICEDTVCWQQQLLQHSQVLWLSRGKVLSRVFEFPHELLLFLREKKTDWTKSVVDRDWIVKVAYLSDFFPILHGLNSSLQG